VRGQNLIRPERVLWTSGLCGRIVGAPRTRRSPSVTISFVCLIRFWDVLRTWRRVLLEKLEAVSNLDR
jgi:hypothetical protein